MSLYSDLILAEPALVSYWRLGETSGTSAADSKGSNTGTYTGGPTLNQTGLLRNDSDPAVALDGVDDYVNIPSVAGLQLVSDLALELWLKPSSLATRGSPLSKGYVAEFEITTETDGGVNYYHGGDGQDHLGAAGTIVSGATHHLVVVRDHTNALGGGAKKVYLHVNGVVVGTWTYVTNPVADTWPVNIGKRANQGGLLFTGTEDEIAIYGSILTPTQIKQHFAVGRRSSLVIPRRPERGLILR